MMKAKFIFFLKLFLLSTLVFWCISLFVDFLYSEEIEIKSLFSRSLIFGSIVSIVLGSFQLLRMEMKDLSSTQNKDFNVKQEATVESNLTLDEIYQILKYKYKSVKYDGKQIKIKIPANLYSWGETVKITESTNQKTEYNITSQPLLPTTLLDFGKNQENILAIKYFIK